MKILMTPEVYLKLCIIEGIADKREFSGYGFVEVEERDDDKVFLVYDIELLDIGSLGYTEFNSQAILKVLEREDASHMKLWFHAHPLGNGKPGPHNWSGTDNDTCINEPLGCPDPMKVKWALAMVLTPKGWVGRLDQFKDNKHKVTHLPVGANVDWSFVKHARSLLGEQEEREKATQKIEHQVSEVKYIDMDSTDTFDTAHSAIDEAEEVLRVAKCQIKDGFIDEAIDSINWAFDIAQQYKHSAYVKHKAQKLLEKVTRLKRKLRKVAV
jgi:hypothetical protein